MTPVQSLRAVVVLRDEHLAADIVVVVDALSSGAPVRTIAVREVELARALGGGDL